jgi:curli biogenesis system outer membrane secretion channel CsgG
MKNYYFIILFLFSFSTLFSQSEKTPVGILPFTSNSNSINYEYVNSIQEEVTTSFVSTKRFNIVDRSKMDALKKEKELQKSEDFIDGTVVQQGKNLGAEFLISGHVNSASAEEFTFTDTNGKLQSGGYKAKVSISLKIIDVATGQVTISETIEPKGGSVFAQMTIGGESTADAAINKAIINIHDKVDEFVVKNFPVTFLIAEIQEKDSKGNATTILVAGGNGFGLQKGDQLQVVEIIEMDVNGKKIIRKKEIGALKISKVEDENFSICSVKSGGLDINSKFESKAKLQVITKK